MNLIVKFNDYKLDKEIDFLFNSHNESFIDFKNKLLNLIPKLESDKLQEFIDKLLIFLQNKSLIFKKMSMSILLIGLYNVGYNNKEIDNIMNNTNIEVLVNDTELKIAMEEAKMETYFIEYKDKANLYLSRDNWRKTHITGEMFANSAKRAYKKHGVIVPLELALAQAQFESGFGMKGLSPKNNPFNVGEFDDGTKIRFKSTEEGVNAYFNLIAKDYLKNKTLDDLLNNFVNYDGKRYASNKDYENNLKKQIEYNKRWLSKNK